MTVTTRRRDVLALAALGVAAGGVRPAKAAAPSGQLNRRCAHHIGADLARSR